MARTKGYLVSGSACLSWTAAPVSLGPERGDSTLVSMAWATAPWAMAPIRRCFDVLTASDVGPAGAFVSGGSRLWGDVVHGGDSTAGHAAAGRGPATTLRTTAPRSALSFTTQEKHAGRAPESPQPNTPTNKRPLSASHRQ